MAPCRGHGGKIDLYAGGDGVLEVPSARGVDDRVICFEPHPKLGWDKLLDRCRHLAGSLHFFNLFIGSMVVEKGIGLTVTSALEMLLNSEPGSPPFPAAAGAAT